MYSFNASWTVAFFVRQLPKRKASSRSLSPIGRLVGIPHPSPHKRRFARPIIRHARPPTGVAHPNHATALQGRDAPWGTPRGVSEAEKSPPSPAILGVGRDGSIAVDHRACGVSGD